MDTAVDTLTTTLNAYGIETDQVSKISDKLITTQNLGKTTVNELGSSLGKVLAIEVAYEILGSAATKPTAWVDIHCHHPLHLLLITIYRQLEEIWALILTWLLTQALAESTYISPLLQVL